MTDLINEFLKTDFGEDKKKIKDLLVEFSEESNIEKVKAESLVMNELIRGTTKFNICKLLREKYPNYVFSLTDLDRFLERNNEIVKQMEVKQSLTARRHLAARSQIEEELARLYMFTKRLLKKFDAEGDNNATLGAIKALNQTLVNYCKLISVGGFSQTEGSKTNIEINVGGDRRVAKTLEANFKMVDNQLPKEEEEKEPEVNNEEIPKE